MSKRIVSYCTLLLVVLTSTVIAWAPFIMRGQFATIYKNFDGPLYIIPAKTAYSPESFKLIDRDPSLPHNPLYYAAHLPLYPFFIYLGSFAIGFLKSMVGVTVLSSVVLAWFFYYFLKKLNLTKHPLLLSSVFLFLPRFLVVRTVGSPEPLFLLFIIGSLFFFEKKNYFFAGLLGGLATMTKMPGILLFPAYMLVLLESFIVPNQTKKLNLNWFYLLLIPLGLFAVFGIYYIQYKDFFAYFHTGATVPMPYPFAVFNSQAKWVGTPWLEDVLFYFALYISTCVVLWKSKLRSIFYFSLVFLTATLFVQHRDISRYSLPLWPLAAIAFEQVLTSKKTLIVGGVLLFGIYLYVWNFLGANTLPISEWLPFL
ncbi:MAG: hypothetical protein V1922_01280 [bacterium]